MSQTYGHRNALVSFLSTFLLVLALPASAIPRTQVQVNTFTQGQQKCPHVAPTDSGGFLVVWESNLGDTIRMRYLDADGTPASDPITVSDIQEPVPNAATSCFYTARSVLLADGSHLITWWSQGEQTAYGKRFLADGTPSASFELHAEWAARPSALSGGGFVLVYMIGGLGIPSQQDVAARIFANDGTPVTEEFLINELTTGSQRLPAVSSTPDGGFIAVWESNVSSGDDNDDFSIQGRRFSALGVALGAQFQVNDIIAGRQQRADIGVGPTGEFMVTWDSISSAGDDQSSFSIQGRRFSSDATPLGGQQQINLTTQNWQTFAHVSIASNGEAQVVWESLASNGNDTGCRSLFTRRFAADGTALDLWEQSIALAWEGAQRWVQLAMLPSDEILFVWMSQSSFGNDEDNYSVQARPLVTSGSLLSDGFESGTLEAWLFESSLVCDQSSSIGW